MPKALPIDTDAVAAWKAVEKAAGLSPKFGGADLADLLTKFQDAWAHSRAVCAQNRALREAQEKLPDDVRYSKNECSKSATAYKNFQDSCGPVGDTLNKFSVGCTTYKKKVEAKKDIEKDKHKAVMAMIARFIADVNGIAKTSLKKMMQDEAAEVAKRKKEEDEAKKNVKE